MRKKILIGALIIIVLLATIATCPSEKAHKDKLISIVETSLRSDETAQVNGPFAAMGKLLSGPLLQLALSNNFKVKDYFLFSIGQIEVDGKKYTTSIGVLNHVFSFREKDIKSFVKS